jgi:Xaa-Pro aminopeptidase
MVRLISLVAAVALLTVSILAQDCAVPPSEYQARRARLANTIGADGVFVAFSFEPARRTGDVDWPFRQEDNLLYLTGMNVPDTTLVLLPGEPDHQELIFATDRDPSTERWTGRIRSPQEVTAVTGVREVRSARQVDAFVDALFRGTPFGDRSPGRYYTPPVAPSVLSAFRAGRAEVWLLLQDRGSRRTLTREQQFAKELRRRYPEVKIRDASPALAANEHGEYSSGKPMNIGAC